MRLTYLFIALVAACGGGSGGGSGGSGIPAEKPAVELTSDEVQDLCEYLIPLNDPRTVPCPEQDEVIEDRTVADCIESVTQDLANLAAVECTITAGDYEACQEAFVTASDAEICEESIPAACEAYVACFQF